MTLCADDALVLGKIPLSQLVDGSPREMDGILCPIPGAVAQLLAVGFEVSGLHEAAVAAIAADRPHGIHHGITGLDAGAFPILRCIKQSSAARRKIYKYALPRRKKRSYTEEESPKSYMLVRRQRALLSR